MVGSVRRGDHSRGNPNNCVFINEFPQQAQRQYREFVVTSLRAKTCNQQFHRSKTSSGQHFERARGTFQDVSDRSADVADATDAPRPGEGVTARIAFLFTVRGDIPHEPLWRRFFRGYEEKYSLYVHATPGHAYPQGSVFEGREVPSKPSPRFSRGLVDAFRRLLSYALLDPRYNNVWFVNVCESSIPIRGFAFAYTYLMKSNVSFVESFFPVALNHSWETLPEFPLSDLRKGELWMGLKRDHAVLIVSDSEIYFAFLAKCSWWCTWDEQYVQTLLHLRDAEGIAERTVMYVNWTTPHGGSPNALSGSVGVIKGLQSRMRDTDGERHDTAFDNSTYECVHEGVAPSPCFLFARKFASSETKALLSLNPQDLGY